MDETLMTYLRNIISLEQVVYVETSGRCLSLIHI